jgi:N-acetylglucosaminyldiphosphoundecaprenol N-acetyl-beta-D-mannosaminyltransferase
MRVVNILDVPVSCCSREDLLSQVITWCREEQRRTITYVNAHCLNLAQSDPGYHQLLNQCDLVYADGVSVVWASRLLGGCPLEKITGRDWIYDFCRLAARRDIRVFILAGEPGIADRAGRVLRRQFPDLKVVGTHSGFLTERGQEAVLSQIEDASPDMIFVGMGAPLQEKWIWEHREEMSASVCWAVGALFDYVAGEEPPVPSWMERMALEWLWRFFVDPSGKWKRYLVGNPVFLFRLLRSLLR